MACKQLLRGQDIRCINIDRKYYQQIVLINKDDVNEVAYSVNDESHAIAFNLVNGATGYKYIGSDLTSLYNASFSKTTRKGQPLYNHTLNLPVIGVGTTTKLILKELDLSTYFGAIQFRDGTIEIYGFENGLKTNDYTYEVQNGLGGTSITLSSKFEEENIPYIYGGNSSDFDNNFVDIGALLGGDFNDDFSNDFYIIQL